jgi:hypothetical protein
VFQLTAGALQKLNPKRIRIGQDAPFEERRHHPIDALFGDFATLPWRVAHQAIVGFHADEHGIALQNCTLATVISES